MNLDADVDIDMGDREQVLTLIKHIPAAMRRVTPIRKHPSGIYITDIPYDPVNEMSALDYADADQRGYFKLDILNVHIYNQVRDEAHLLRLMQEPDWDRLKDKKFVEQLIHLGNHFNSIQKMPEPINSIPRLAMFLAVIRPAKKHLIGKSWKEINETVWDKDIAGYGFKRSHSCSYAQLVVVHMNLLCEQERNGM
jgi:hypothetical protein